MMIKQIIQDYDDKTNYSRLHMVTNEKYSRSYDDKKIIQDDDKTNYSRL